MFSIYRYPVGFLNWHCNDLTIANEVFMTDRNRKYKDYVYRKMLVQEYLKKWRIFKRVKPKNDMMIL